MRVQCPNCGVSGSIPNNKVPPTGITITCPKCKSTFFVQKQEPQESKGQDVSAWYKEGVKLLKERQLDAAIEKFNLVIQAIPQYAEAYRYLGLAYGQKSLWAEASQVLQKAITYRPDDVQSLRNLGVAYLKQKKFGEAEQVLQEALKYAPSDEKVKSYLSIAIQKKEQHQAFAVSQRPSSSLNTNKDILSEPIAPSPRTQRSSQRNPIHELLDKGVEYLDNAQYNQALEAFNEVIRLEPNRSDGYFGLGLVYEKREEWTKAIEAYQKALELNPNDRTAKENLKFAKKREKKKSRWKFWKK